MILDPQPLVTALFSVAFLVVLASCGLSVLLTGIWRKRAGLVLGGGVLLCGIVMLGVLLATLPRHWWVSLLPIFLGLQSIRVWREKAKSNAGGKVRLSTLLLVFSFFAMGMAGAGSFYRKLKTESPIVSRLEQLQCEIHREFDGVASTLIVVSGGLPDVDEILRLTSKLSCVRQIQITGQHISIDGVGYIRKQRGLRILSLQGTSIDDQDLELLARLKDVRQLDLMDTKVSGSGLKHLYGMKSLRHLWISRAHISPADVSALRAKLPQLEVSY